MRQDALPRKIFHRGDRGHERDGVSCDSEGCRGFGRKLPGRRLQPAGTWLAIFVYGGLGVVAVGAIGYGGWQYWSVWRFEVSTDDAYVQADVVAIAPQVAGQISEVLVDDNQAVKAGDILARIDPRDYQTAVDQAKSGVPQAEAEIASIDAELSEQHAVIDEAEAHDQGRSGGERLCRPEQPALRHIGEERLRHGSERAQAQPPRRNPPMRSSSGTEAALVAAQKQVDTINAQRARSQGRRSITLARL